MCALIAMLTVIVGGATASHWPFRYVSLVLYIAVFTTLESFAMSEFVCLNLSFGSLATFTWVPIYLFVLNLSVASVSWLIMRPRTYVEQIDDDIRYGE